MCERVNRTWPLEAGFAQSRAMGKSKTRDISKDDEDNLSEVLKSNRKSHPGHPDSSELSDFYKKKKKIKYTLKHFSDLSWWVGIQMITVHRKNYSQMFVRLT